VFPDDNAVSGALSSLEGSGLRAHVTTHLIACSFRVDGNGSGLYLSQI
jgi:hypothetical protein